MNVVDSSAWLEYFADGPSAKNFASVIEAVDEVIVPSIAVLEVYKVVARQRGEAAAIIAVSTMMRARVEDLDARLSLDAARLGLEEKLPLADSIVLATARRK